MNRLHQHMRKCLIPATGLVALTTALLLGPVPASLAGGKEKVTSANKVKATATSAKADSGGEQVITVKLVVEKGWHLYANPVNHEDFESNRTVVTVKADGKPVPAKVTYPKGRAYKDGNGTYNVYEGETLIRAVVNRGDAGPLQVHIQVNACDDRKCLPPGVITLKVE